MLDLLDGRIARLTGTTSEFGGELDSLADVISFGVAPALLAYRWGFAQAIPRVGWLAAFLFVMCGALRLARFNVQRHAVDGRYFVGLPIPAAAAQVAALVHFLPEGPSARAGGARRAGVVVALVVPDGEHAPLSLVQGASTCARRRSYITVLGIALLFLLVALQPEWVAARGGQPLLALGAGGLRRDRAARRRPRPPAPVAAGEALSRTARGAGRPPRVGVGGVVIHDGRVLLIRRGKEPLRGRWVDPRRHGGAGRDAGGGAGARDARGDRSRGAARALVLAVFDRIQRDGGAVAYHYVIVDYLCDYVSGDGAGGLGRRGGRLGGAA